MADRIRNAISPYVRSHADNPVDWWGWGPQAFAEAARRDVPVLVSIGYATCHWCHVMARETFSDPRIAAQLNRNLVCVKVDREEHPEVDELYLAAAGAFTSDLGWPLNVFVTPGGAAFHAITYAPPVRAPGRPSFAQVAGAVAEAWRDRRPQVLDGSARLVEALAEFAALGHDTGAALPPNDRLHAAARELAAGEDHEHGGFGTAPKFPQAPLLRFLAATGGEPAAAARRALARMAESDLRDHVDGGFFRYSTRADWSVPHFERMLPDNALLLSLYARRQREGDPAAAAVASGLVGFLSETMLLESGMFASAQNSESRVGGRLSEGGYYALPAAERANEPRPGLDNKVITGWNGLAIGALAEAGRAANRPEWITRAVVAADALLGHHLDDRGGQPSQGGVLIHASTEGEYSAAPATLADYGMLAGGLLDLAEATGLPRYALAARNLIDATRGGTTESALPFAVPGGGDAVLRAQGMPSLTLATESAAPSGLAAIVRASWRLAALTGERGYAEDARRAVAAVADVILRAPAGYAALLECALDLGRPVTQLVVITPETPERGDALVAAAHGFDGDVLLILTEGEAQDLAMAGWELCAGRPVRDGRATAYLCRDSVCALPITDAAELRAALTGSA